MTLEEMNKKIALRERHSRFDEFTGECDGCAELGRLIRQRKGLLEPRLPRADSQHYRTNGGGYYRYGQVKGCGCNGPCPHRG